VNVLPHPPPKLSRGTSSRGRALLNSPSLNKGAAFSQEERTALQLNGLLPAVVTQLQDQVQNALIQYERLPDDLSRNLYLTELHDRNEVLFFRLFSEHLREMIPMVNDFTVGVAIEHYNHECRRARGVYLSINNPDPISIHEAFLSFGVSSGAVDLILATDAEHILGIGDWGIGGMEVAIGKLAIHTAAGGLDPASVIPVMLDTGTNNQALLNDPLYIGNRHPRITGDRYFAFLDAYVNVVSSLYPGAMLQWEDFSSSNSRHIVSTYGKKLPSFNDDLQGTGAIALAAAISATRANGSPLRTQRIVVFGAGTAGTCAADSLRDAMIREGMSHADATSRFWLVDTQGLLTTASPKPLLPHQLPYARPSEESATWKNAPNIYLAELVHRIQPTMMIGASSIRGAFSQDMVRALAATVVNPIFLILSNPASSVEATPADLLSWCSGRALIATCAYFPPVTHFGLTHSIGQMNNSMLYPGLALGVIVSGASRISQSMLAAAASAVSSLVSVRQPGSSLLPFIDDLRRVSLTVAVAVAGAAQSEGLSRKPLHDILQQVKETMWQPEYSPLLAI
jgi:malate dehydrogenase (oxaloacetate-decarboxylating)